MVNSFLLPDFLEELPKQLQVGWLEIYRNIYADYGESIAKVAANKWLRKEIEMMDTIEEPEAMDIEEEKQVIVSEPKEEDKPSTIKITFEIDTDKGQKILSQLGNKCKFLLIVTPSSYYEQVIPDHPYEHHVSFWPPEKLRDCVAYESDRVPTGDAFYGIWISSGIRRQIGPGRYLEQPHGKLSNGHLKFEGF